MYFVSDSEETILDIVGIEVAGIDFEVMITKTFFAYEDDMYAKKHNHAHFEVFFNKGCSGKMLVENTRQDFCEGSMIIIAPKVYHSYKPDQNSSACTQKYNLKFRPEEGFYSDGVFESFEYKYVNDASRAIEIIEAIHAVYGKGKDQFAFRQEIRSLFTLLMIEILRSMALKKEEMHEQKAFDRQANEIEAFFEAHYGSFPPPSKLAAQLCVSTRQLDRIIKQLFSMSFSAKLTQTKTELAKDLLETSGLSAAQISEKLGYNSPASFSAAFKKQTGISPGAYRKRNGGEEK